MSDLSSPANPPKFIIRNAKPRTDLVLSFAIGGVLATALGIWCFSQSGIGLGIVFTLIGAYCLFMAIAFTIKGNDRSPQFTLSQDGLLHHPSGYSIAWDKMINLRWERKVILVNGVETGSNEAKIYIQSSDEPEMETALNVYALELSPEQIVAKIREWWAVKSCRASDSASRAAHPFNAVIV